MDGTGDVGGGTGSREGSGGLWVGLELIPQLPPVVTGVPHAPLLFGDGHPPLWLVPVLFTAGVAQLLEVPTVVHPLTRLAVATGVGEGIN